MARPPIHGSGSGDAVSGTREGGKSTGHVPDTSGAHRKMASPVRLTYDHETHNVCGCTTGTISMREGRRDRRRRRLPSCLVAALRLFAVTPA
jgi:hypothetical protein